LDEFVGLLPAIRHHFSPEQERSLLSHLQEGIAWSRVALRERVLLAHKLREIEAAGFCFLRDRQVVRFKTHAETTESVALMTQKLQAISLVHKSAEDEAAAADAQAKAVRRLEQQLEMDACRTTPAEDELARHLRQSGSPLLSSPQLADILLHLGPASLVEVARCTKKLWEASHHHHWYAPTCEGCTAPPGACMCTSGFRASAAAAVRVGVTLRLYVHGIVELRHAMPTLTDEQSVSINNAAFTPIFNDGDEKRLQGKPSPEVCQEMLDGYCRVDGFLLGSRVGAADKRCLREMTPSDLKEELGNLKLPTTGSKTELLARLCEALPHRFGTGQRTEMCDFYVLKTEEGANPQPSHRDWSARREQKRENYLRQLPARDIPCSALHGGSPLT